MHRNIRNVLAAIALVLIFVSAAFAQQGDPSSAQKSAADANAERGIKSKIFDVKYRDADKLAQVLHGLGSRSITIVANREFKTITVRDLPENLVIMEEALKRLDVPITSRPNIELHMHVLIASNASGTEGPAAQVPAELKDVLAQLRETLTYRKYELATSVVQRLTTDMARGVEAKGSVEISNDDPKGPNVIMIYQFNIMSVSLVENLAGGPTVQIGDFRFAALTDKDRAEVQTGLNLRDGEKVVVGTATVRNRALVVVLISKMIK